MGPCGLLERETNSRLITYEMMIVPLGLEPGTFAICRDFLMFTTPTVHGATDD